MRSLITNSNNNSYNSLNTILKNQGLGLGQPGGSAGESSKSEPHVPGSSPSNHQFNLSKTVREYHLELIDTLSHVECVKCMQALGTLIINHPSLTSSTLPPHAFFGAATGMPILHHAIRRNHILSYSSILSSVCKRLGGVGHAFDVDHSHPRPNHSFNPYLQ